MFKTTMVVLSNGFCVDPRFLTEKTILALDAVLAGSPLTNYHQDTEYIRVDPAFMGLVVTSTDTSKYTPPEIRMLTSDDPIPVIAWGYPLAKTLKLRKFSSQVMVLPTGHCLHMSSAREETWRKLYEQALKDVEVGKIPTFRDNSRFPRVDTAHAGQILNESSRYPEPPLLTKNTPVGEVIPVISWDWPLQCYAIEGFPATPKQMAEWLASRK